MCVPGSLGCALLKKAYLCYFHQYASMWPEDNTLMSLAEHAKASEECAGVCCGKRDELRCGQQLESLW